MKRHASIRARGRIVQQYLVECLGPIRLLGIAAPFTLERKWTDHVGPVDDPGNLVVNEGLDYYLDRTLKAAGYTATWYVMLTDGSPTIAAGDVMASHAGWVEVQTYSEAVRETLTLGTVASQSVDNSASKASFSINGSATVGGAGITSSSTKGGTTGTLLGVGAFTGGDRTMASGDTLNVTATLTMAAP